jgi:nucleoside-diphosphate-sugar epimerase
MTGWVDVRDVATVVFQSMTSQYNGERYIISSGNHTYQSIFEKIANHLHVHAPKQALSSRMGNLLWRLESSKVVVAAPKTCDHTRNRGFDVSRVILCQ